MKKLTLFLFALAGWAVTAGAQNITHSNIIGPDGSQINTQSGNLHLQRIDLSIDNTGISIDWTAAYNSFRDSTNRGLGPGWTTPYSMSYRPDSSGMIVERADGRQDTFQLVAGQYVAPLGVFDQWEEYQSGQFRLQDKFGMRYFFDNAAHRSLTKMEDRNGNQLTLAYNGDQLSSITDGSSRQIFLEWTADNISQIRDPNSSPERSIRYSYDANGRLSTVTNPIGGQRIYQYKDNGLLASVKDENGALVQFQYDLSRRVVAMQSCFRRTDIRYNEVQRRTYVVESGEGKTQRTSFHYDQDGRLIRREGACCGFQNDFNYDADNNISQRTDANGAVETTNFDTQGNGLLLTDALGNDQSLTYDSDFNQLLSFTDKRQQTTRYAYDSKGNPTEIIQALNSTVRMGYDTQGNLTSVTDANNNRTEMTYTANNNLESVRYPIGDFQMGYDGVGNLVRSTDGNQNSVSSTYDALDRLTSVTDDLGNRYTYGYDDNSNLNLERDPNGNETRLTYDAHNRLARVQTANSQSDFTYDAFDNLLSITDANQHTYSFAYDERNLVTEEKDALGRTRQFDYDGNGNVIQQRQADGQIIQYDFDALNRMTSRTYTGNSDNYQYDANGNLIYCANKDISIQYTYDELNRLIEQRVVNWNKSIRYEYDAAGNRIAMTDPDGGRTTYTYDGNNRLTSLTNPQMEMTRFTYDDGGRLTRQIHANGTIINYQYDSGDRLLSIENRRSTGDLISSLTYTYDRFGNRLSSTDQSGARDSYSYDGDNRLTQVRYKSGLQEQYSYDGTSNRSSLSRNGQTQNYSYDAADQLLSDGTASYQFDDNGSLISKTSTEGTTRYEYDGEQRLLRISLPDGERIEYEYDPLGKRISRTDANGTIRYLYDGENVLMEMDENGQVQASYTTGLELDNHISLQRAGNSYYYHKDALGSTTALSGAQQGIAATYDYDAYGQLINSTGSVDNPYTYTGREYEASAGLYYYRTRYYDPANGRFTSRDLFPGVMQMPASMNKYTYAEGNPINHVDPYGTWVFPLLIGAGINFGWQYYKYNGRMECIDLYDVALSGALGGAGLGVGAGLKSFLPLISKSLRSIFATSYNRLPWYKKGIKFFLGNKRYNDIPSLGFWRHREIRRIARETIGKSALINYFGTWAKSASNLVNYKGDVNFDCTPDRGIRDLIPDPVKDFADSIFILIVRAVDPNEIIPPPGYGTRKWVAGNATLPYTILFENDPEFATAPAQKVIIEHYLDDDLNPFSFRLGNFGFGDFYFEVEDDLSYYNDQLDLTDSLGIIIKVVAGIEADQRRAFWIFESIDPDSGLPTTLAADQGFLPINDTISRAGEGFVDFRVRPWSDSPTGDTIEAIASIIFDDNAPISTNLAFNTIDADAPKSSLSDVEISADQKSYTLQFEGSDEGAGLASYAVYSSTNGRPFVRIAEQLDGSPFNFQGQADSTYRFFSQATDHVGNVEELKNSGEPACMQVSIGELVNATDNQANGSASIVVSGQVGQLNFQWSHDANERDSVAQNLAAAEYSVTVTDASGCSVTLFFTVERTTGLGTAADNGLFLHQLFPVPAHHELYVDFTAQGTEVDIQLIDVHGRHIRRYQKGSTAGQRQRIRLAIDELASGSYVLLLSDGQRQVRGQFVKLD
ncbi:MAG: RHS repeat-associated core domain-containing protein [Bacteroidota bacterium]